MLIHKICGAIASVFILVSGLWAAERSSPFICSHLSSVVLIESCGQTTGELTEAKNKLLDTFVFVFLVVCFFFASLYFSLGQTYSLTCCAANSCAGLWVRINPGDRETGAKVLLVKQCPEGAAKQFSWTSLMAHWGGCGLVYFSTQWKRKMLIAGLVNWIVCSRWMLRARSVVGSRGGRKPCLLVAVSKVAWLEAMQKSGFWCL